MADAKKWDLTSTNAIGAAAEWLRKRGDGIVVVIIRAQDVGIAVDPRVTPLDAMELLRAELPTLTHHLEMQRLKRKSDAKK